jgi:hypothetical protein
VGINPDFDSDFCREVEEEVEFGDGWWGIEVNVAKREDEDALLAEIHIRSLMREL